MIQKETKHCRNEYCLERIHRHEDCGGAHRGIVLQVTSVWHPH